MIKLPGQSVVRRMRILISISCSILLLSCACLPIRAAEELSANSKEKLGRLEFKLFGHAFDSENADERAARLEDLILGEQKTGTAQQRIEDILALYKDEELAPPKPEAPPVKQTKANGTPAAAKHAANSAPSPYRADSSDSLSDVEAAELKDYPKITALESAILGHTYEKDPLSARLSQLETAAFGTPTNILDYSQRTDKLEEYAEKKLHKKVIASSSQMYQVERPTPNTPPSNKANMSKAAIAMAANTLLGMTGLGGLGMIPGAAMGMLGTRPGANRPQDTVPPQNDADLSAAPDTVGGGNVDPSLLPSADAKIQTKVAWCEQQVYGQTFPNKHLTDRLRMLSEELHVCAGKSDFELMDDIGIIIKAAQSRMKPKAIGSTDTAPETK